MTEFLRKITKSDIRNILAVITVISAFVLLILMLFKPIPVENKDILNISIGIVLGGLLGGINGFYFGASKTEPKVEEENKTP